jgi:serine/threonine protein phosphatase 1
MVAAGSCTMSKTYAIADLHGRFDLLIPALDQIAKHANRHKFKIVAIGDYIDRGPESRQIIEHLMALQKAMAPIVCLQGNHESMMVETIRTPLHPEWWIGNGGGQTLISYGHPRSGDYQPDVVPEEHLVWLENLPLMHIDQHRVFVHAGVDQLKPLDQQDPQSVLWKIYDGNDPGGHDMRHVVHGHHARVDGPILLSGRTNLDTCAYYTGRLVVGVFDDDLAGGPVDFIEVRALPRLTPMAETSP